ncbi:hypothetical protein ACFPYI_15215 [Halomarina salina]|uniref:Zinc ribbon domain-containing protein n=1 Tax=Halomarina salina TaxID=1872699 RepID=A0ABD5RRE8_9EURY|nr:hypothetical protein [Halomarina salina]
MSIIRQVKQAIGMEGETEHTYSCRDCQRTFESTEASMANVACPECGGHNVRQIV